MVLYNEIISCKKCKLYETCKSPIPWDGNFNAKILFVWEAPGKDEDKQGKPFVWRSWQFLTSVLEEIWLTREKDYYITNIVKCRPPDNRDPKLEEIQTCSPYLIKQLQEWNFKIIVTLWRFSMNFFIPDLQISKDHGKIFKIIEFRWQKFENWLYLLPSYHPAVALYNPSKKEIIKKDLQKLKILLEKV
jgi:DNA polymerase